MLLLHRERLAFGAIAVVLCWNCCTLSPAEAFVNKAFFGPTQKPITVSIGMSVLGDIRARARQRKTETLPSPSEDTQIVPTSADDITTSNKKKDDKFSFAQRIESVKCVVVGALSGGIAVAPVTALHDFFFSSTFNQLAQWEFDTDMGALQAALFAIVYRYAIRDDTNPMLNQGVIGAFVLVRTLSNINVSPSCTAAPLSCGEPLGYFDWSMLSQAAINGFESLVLFGAVALAMDKCFDRGFISKFK